MVHGPLIYQYTPKKETTAVYLTEDEQTIKDAETSTNNKPAEENNKFTHVRLVFFLFQCNILPWPVVTWRWQTCCNPESIGLIFYAPTRNQKGGMILRQRRHGPLV